MGSDTPATPTPAAAPSVSETSAESIQAQIDALPKILAAQQQYGGAFSQQSLDSLNQYGPQFAQSALNLEQQFAPQYKQISDTLNPEIGAAQSYLTDYLNGTGTGGTGNMSPQDQADYNSLSPGIMDQIRSGQSSRGIGAISPLGSVDESVQLAQLKQSLKDRRLNAALSTAGRTPIGGMTNVQGTSGTGQLVQNGTADNNYGYASSLNNFNASIFNTQGGIYSSQSSNQGDPLGSILGGITGGLTGGLSTGLGYGLTKTTTTCWVAATVFDGWDDIRTINARKFILNDAPKWFRDLYILKGEQFAKFISNKNWLKNLIRPLFTWMAKKGSV